MTTKPTDAATRWTFHRLLEGTTIDAGSGIGATHLIAYNEMLVARAANWPSDSEYGTPVLVTALPSWITNVTATEARTTTQTRDRFATLADARQHLDGTAEWDWGTVASFDGWTRYAYRHAVETTTDEACDDDGLRWHQDWTWDHDACLRAYLVSVGVDPREFGL